MDDFVQGWSNLHIEYFKIWHLNSSYGARRLEIINWFNHLHFFDPLHSFRRKISTGGDLCFESCFHTKNDCGLESLWNCSSEYLLSLLSDHIVLWWFHRYCRTRSQWPCCKCRHWHCALILSVFTCVTSLRPFCFRDSFSVSMHVRQIEFFEDDLWVNQT